MRTGRKLWKIMIAALLVVPLFAGGLSALAEEEPATADVTLHKRVFQDAIPEGYPKVNTGLEDPSFGGDPLAGAGFTVYDVTAEYHQAILGTDQAAAMNAVIAAYNLDAAAFTAKSVQVTDAAGVAKFNALPMTSGGKDAAYLFVETSTPASPTIIQKAAPFILAMPIYTATGANGVLNKDIHVYPKNVKADNKKEMTNIEDFETVTIGEGASATTHPNVQIGDTLNYQLTVQIPADIAEKVSFTILDRPGAGMAVQTPANVVVQGLTAADYTLTISPDRKELDIALNMASAAVKALAGTALIITYDMELTADAVPDTVIENNASIKVNGNTTTEMTPPPGVVTGGKQFIKKDAHTGKTLAGATFKVTNGTEWAKFVVNGKGEYAFAGWGTKADASEVTAAADGTFKVIGLLAGNYGLEEISAPDGYVLLADGVDFTVTVPGYGSTEQLRLTVNNVPKGLLPSTGGTGIYSFLIIGAMMMAGAYIWFKRSKEQAEV